MTEKKAKKAIIRIAALKSWIALNDVLREADLKTCVKLLEAEKEGRRRAQFLKRIHARLNKVRADRERAEFA